VQMSEAGTHTSPELLQSRTSQPNQRNRENSLARRRFQKGSVKLIGGKWRGRWREDVVLADGTVKRVNKKTVLGTKEDFATKRLASRELEVILAPINSVQYRPTHQITFAEFARRWSEKVKPIAYKQGGSQATAGRHVNGKLVPAFGNIELKDITTEVLQSYVADLLAGGLSAKYVRNIVSTMSAMWDVAVSWKYVNHKPFAALILPECECSEVEPYSQEEVITIFRSAREPFRTFLWILGETGMRPGEVCALDAKHVHVHDRVISVRQNESLGHIVSPKTHAGYRDFAISAQLAEHLKVFMGAREEGLLFVSKSGRAWRESKVVEKKLNPLLRQLAIKPRGLHSIRHFNATLMDRRNIPIKTRQNRLGHADARLLLGTRNRGGYTHVIGEDDRRAAAMFGDMFSEVLCPDASKGSNAPAQAKEAGV
jgi:integrase